MVRRRRSVDLPLAGKAGERSEGIGTTTCPTMLTSFTPIRAAGFSLREFTKVADATAIPASRGLKPAAQVRIIVARLMKHGTPQTEKPEDLASR